MSSYCFGCCLCALFAIAISKLWWESFKMVLVKALGALGCLEELEKSMLNGLMKDTCLQGCGCNLLSC